MNIMVPTTMYRLLCTHFIPPVKDSDCTECRVDGVRSFSPTSLIPRSFSRVQSIRYNYISISPNSQCQGSRDRGPVRLGMAQGPQTAMMQGVPVFPHPFSQHVPPYLLLCSSVQNTPYQIASVGQDLAIGFSRKVLNR